MMVKKNEGMTKVYNRFHDWGQRDGDVERLRVLQGQLDQVVLQAYGGGIWIRPVTFTRSMGNRTLTGRRVEARLSVGNGGAMR